MSKNLSFVDLDDINAAIVFTPNITGTYKVRCSFAYEIRDDSTLQNFIVFRLTDSTNYSITQCVGEVDCLVYVIIYSHFNFNEGDYIFYVNSYYTNFVGNLRFPYDPSLL